MKTISSVNHFNDPFRSYIENMNASKSENFSCYECEEDHCHQPLKELFVCENAIKCWKSTVRETDGSKRNARGCVGDEHQARMLCNNHKGPQSQYHIECCKEALCNNGPFPSLPEMHQNSVTPESKPSIDSLVLAIAIVVPIVVVVVLLAVLYYCYKKKCCLFSEEEHAEEQPSENVQMADIANDINEVLPSVSNTASVCSYSAPDLVVTAAGDSTIREFFGGQSVTSGSGSGLPQLTVRTFSKQITLGKQMNEGKFGRHCDLWHGIWQGEDVAVKIFPSSSEKIWARETEIYSKYLPSKHDNILGYMGSDTTSVASCTQLWIVTHYHPNGSLRNYLRENTLEYNGMLKLCLSLTRGMLYLHTEITGTQGKMSMAHRNISSKNVFVKNDGNCVIAEFGQAITQELPDDANFFQYASKRYMSPELLERKSVSRNIESFQQADIYSLGLVFWEIGRRCNSSIHVPLQYLMPYSDWLTCGDQEPAVEEMVDVVVIERRRPKIPDHWQTDQTLAVMETMILECWHMNPTARLPILRIKKTLQKLAANNPDVNLPVDW